MWDTGRTSLVRKLRQQLGQGHLQQPPCADTLSPTLSLPQGREEVGSRAEDRIWTQRPDLTPTLDSTGYGAMVGEGLSPNQTNKQKSKCPAWLCYFVITQQKRLELKVMGSGNLNTWFKLYLLYLQTQCPWAICLPSPSLSFLIYEMVTIILPSEGGCKDVADQRLNSVHFRPLICFKLLWF